MIMSKPDPRADNILMYCHLIESKIESFDQPSIIDESLLKILLEAKDFINGNKSVYDIDHANFDFIVRLVDVDPDYIRSVNLYSLTKEDLTKIKQMLEDHVNQIWLVPTWNNFSNDIKRFCDEENLTSESVIVAMPFILGYLERYYQAPIKK